MVNLKKQKINTSQVLGYSASGIIHPYQKSDSDQKWAAKVIKAYSFQEVLQHFENIAVGFSCESPYILPVRGYLIEQDKEKVAWDIFVKIPRMNNGSIRDVLNDHKKNKTLIPEAKIAKYFYEMVCGLQYLHDKNIAHRDIKPDHMLIDENNTIKIADFCLGGPKEDNPEELIHSKHYIALENQDKNDNIGIKGLLRANLWSLGMVLLELCTQFDLRNLDLSWPAEKLEETTKGMLFDLERQEKYSKTLVAMISSLLKHKPTERKALSDIRQQLVSTYGFSKVGRSEFEELNQGLQIKVQQLEKELEARNGYMVEMKKRYKGIIADLEGQLRPPVRQVQMMNPPSSSGYSEEMKMLKMELNKRWDGVFRTENSPNAGIQVHPINQKFREKQDIIGILDDITTTSKKLKCEAFKSLVIDLQFCKSIDDEEMKRIGWHIAVNFRSLTYLNFDLRYCSNIGDRGLSDLGFHIAVDLKSLEELTISLNESPKITDQGIKDLGFHIGANLRTLKRLSLTFHECIQITDKGVKDFAFHIPTNLKNLEQFSLGVVRCPNLTDEGFKELAVSISTRLKSLKRISLVFSDTKATSAGKDFVLSQFKHIHDKHIYA